MHLQPKITTKLVKRVSKRDKTIMSSFRNKSHHKSTELSKYIWELKVNDKNYTIDWLIAMNAHPYFCGMTKSLCENLLIARAASASSLDTRDELV